MSDPLKAKTALYPGSFDCLTYGHLDLIQRACKLFDRLIVAVANNSRKKPLFDEHQRYEHLVACTEEWENVEVHILEGLTIEYAQKVGAQFIVRGLRAVSDFEFEFQMAIMNHQLNDDVETIFLAPSPEYIFLSSSMIKEISRLGGDVSEFIPPLVLGSLEETLERANEY